MSDSVVQFVFSYTDIVLSSLDLVVGIRDENSPSIIKPPKIKKSYLIPCVQRRQTNGLSALWWSKHHHKSREWQRSKSDAPEKLGLCKSHWYTQCRTFRSTLKNLHQKLHSCTICVPLHAYSGRWIKKKIILNKLTLKWSLHFFMGANNSLTFRSYLNLQCKMLKNKSPNVESPNPLRLITGAKYWG